MKFIKRCFVLMVFLSVATFSSANTLGELKLGNAPVEDTVKAMMLDEKVMIVRGTGMAMETGGPQVVVTKDKAPGAAGTTYAIERLGIPSTVFPVATLMGSNWNPPPVQKFGQAVGNEAKAYGIDVKLAPALNIHRHAMGGRNFEYFSEDPVVSGMMSAAYVEGLQHQGSGATLKQFVAKTTLLAPDASEDIVFTLTEDDLVSFNTEKGAWYAEAGLYDVHLASSSKNIFSTQRLEFKKPFTSRFKGDCDV